MSIGAGLFLFVFGALGTWLLRAKFPHARVMPIAYVLMSIGGLVFVVWTLTHALAFGVAGAVLLVAAGILGMIGAMRKEIRVAPPG